MGGMGTPVSISTKSLVSSHQNSTQSIGNVHQVSDGSITSMRSAESDRKTSGVQALHTSSTPISRTISAEERNVQKLVDADLARESSGKFTKHESARLRMRQEVLRKIQQESLTKGDDSVELVAQVGCAAVCVVVTKTHLVCANAGDAGAVLCRDGRTINLSSAHKPNTPSERRRIEASGGIVQHSCGNYMSRPHYRVRPCGLNMSRAIGDLDAKSRLDLAPDQQMICSTPDIVVIDRSEADEFIVLACDGVWDTMKSTQVCDFVHNGLVRCESLPSILEELLGTCICSDPKDTCGVGADNMTCVVAQLRDGPFEVIRRRGVCLPLFGCRKS